MSNALASILTAGATAPGSATRWTTSKRDSVTVETFAGKDSATPTIIRARLSSVLVHVPAVESVVVDMLAAAGVDVTPDVVADAGQALAQAAADMLASRTPGVAAVVPGDVFVRRALVTHKDKDAEWVVVVDHARRAGRTLPLSALVGEDIAGAVAEWLSA